MHVDSCVCMYMCVCACELIVLSDLFVQFVMIDYTNHGLFYHYSKHTYLLTFLYFMCCKIVIACM